jgi:phosphatidylglycerophosphatase A
VRFVLRHPAHFLALGGGVGLIGFAPGTWGTLLAFPIFWGAAYAGVSPQDAPLLYLAGVALLFALGVWACSVAGTNLGAPDHGSMVWDETVAFLLVLFFAPRYSYYQALAFVLFRFFDIAKPPPIRYYERKFKGGYGVMIDDLLAAGYALLALAAVRAILN